MVITMNYMCVLLLVGLLSLPVMSIQQEQKTYRFLALGDSYTIGESVAEADRWPVQLVRRFNEGNFNVKLDDPKIIATTGWTTQELKAAIKEEKPNKNYDLVSLLIGVNNQYRGYPLDEYPNEFRQLLDIAIEHAGGDKNKVFVISIPDYGFTRFGEPKQEDISKGIDDYNAINQRITEESDIRYYNITDISRNGLADKSLVARDKLHPSGAQYGLWVDRILADPSFMEIFK